MLALLQARILGVGCLLVVLPLLSLRSRLLRRLSLSPWVVVLGRQSSRQMRPRVQPTWLKTPRFPLTWCQIPLTPLPVPAPLLTLITRVMSPLLNRSTKRLRWSPRR